MVSTWPAAAAFPTACVTAAPCTISPVGIKYGVPPAAAVANASRHARVTSSRAASHTTASPLIGWNLHVPNSRVRRSSELAPATCVLPSSRTDPFDPNTWELEPGPVAGIVPRYTDLPTLMRKSSDVVSPLSTVTTRRKLWQYTWLTGPQRSIMPSIAWTPIGVSAPHGVSCLSARHASGFRNSPFGNV